MNTPFISAPCFVLLSAIALMVSVGCGEHQQFLQPIKTADVLRDSSSDTEPDLPQTSDSKELPKEELPPKVVFPDILESVDTEDSQSGDGAEPCEDGSTCSSGICVPSSQGKVCALPCVDSCPEGWICQPFQLPNQDPTVICLDRTIHLCRPCTTHQDCQGLGADPQDRCISFGDMAGSFCGNACEKTSDCPAQYACESQIDAQSGEEMKQCIPVSGQCACNLWARASGAQTSCGVGDCLGTRVCTDDGLSSCSAAASGEEVCNAEDDDCDGFTDEGVGGAPCSLKIAISTCSGLLLCEAGESSCVLDENPELCDNKDNDCDSHIDEDFPDLGGACDGDDADSCANGKYVCAPDGKGLRCTAEGLTNLYESCDGLDNDCDSMTDEAFPELGAACDGSDSDFCAMGVFQCSPDGLGTVCGAEDPANIVELCDGHDNDCNGSIDDVPGGCGSDDDTPCIYHFDCYPERVCALWPELNQKLCSSPCAGNAGCGDGQICSKLPGSAQVGFCHAPPAQGNPAGTVCTQNAHCSSGMCVDGACADFCLNESHCTSTAQACSLVGDSETGGIFSACVDNPPGSVITGGNCQGKSANCETGHCDLTFPFGPWYCSSLCKSEFDCPSYQECNVIVYDSAQSAASIPLDAAWQVKTHDAVTACFTPAITGGSKVDGAACSSHSECSGYKCFSLIPEDAQTYCTSLCSQDSDCITSMQCKMTAMTLVNSWLTDPNVLTQGPMPTAYTLIRICKFK